jgi:putative molybdopterin biosynthesis protein
MRLLTTTEAAEYLRLKERKVYELIAEGAIPCTKVTGKWLFPQCELDHWLASSLLRPKGLRPREAMPIVGGSHDPLLEWALREGGSGLASLPEGSEAGLARFADGSIVACAIHLHTLNDRGDPNVEALQKQGMLHDALLVAFAKREQGFLAASGNPLAIASLNDVIARGARMAMRPKGAGAQLLLISLLHRLGMSLEQIAAVSPPCPTGPDIAQAIRAGRADCGIATRSVANAAGLDFVPITWEQFDLAIRHRSYFHPPLQTLLSFLRTSSFAKRAEEFGGYDVTDAGTIRYAP